jgi:hypothetical protein
MTPDPNAPYSVSTLGKAAESLKRILDRAAHLGIRPEVVAGLYEIRDALTSRPRDWGDPIRNFRQLRMIQYRGLMLPLIAYYAVHDEASMVVFSDLTVPRGLPLAGS